jgi:CRISPR-associated protein Cas2
MTILLLDRVSPGLRGELSRWMLEPKAGVFVGRPTAAVRERLWKRLCREAGEDAGCLMITHATTEQGYHIESYGNPKRVVVDFEGLQLVKTRF